MLQTKAVAEDRKTRLWLIDKAWNNTSIPRIIIRHTFLVKLFLYNLHISWSCSFIKKKLILEYFDTCLLSCFCSISSFFSIRKSRSFSENEVNEEKYWTYCEKIHQLTQSIIHSLTHSLNQSFTQSIIHAVHPVHRIDGHSCFLFVKSLGKSKLEEEKRQNTLKNCRLGKVAEKRKKKQCGFDVFQGGERWHWQSLATPVRGG